MRFLIVLSVLVAGCAPVAPTQFYYRLSDGQRADANPQIFEKFNVDKTICLGERSKVRASMTDDLMAGHDLETVMRGCMAQRGYIVK